MEYPWNYEVLPLKDAIDRHVQTGYPIGDFLTSLFENNLSGAFAHADSTNVKLIHVYVNYLFNECPSVCWGSKEIHDKWLAHKTAKGHN